MNKSLAAVLWSLLMFVPGLVTAQQGHDGGYMVTVWVGAGDSLKVDGKTVDIEDLSAILMPFIEKNGKLHIIRLSVDNTASYRFYTLVQDSIYNCYYDVHDKFSRKRYGRPLRALSKGRKEQINNLFPYRISEAVPD